MKFHNPLLLCTIVQIDRVDGTSLGFTSLNHDINIAGVVFKANNAIDPTATALKINLTTDNLDIKGFIDSSDVTSSDILGGVYDNAYVTIARVDFTQIPTTLDGSIILLKGRIGNIITTDTYFTFEIQSLSEIISRPLHQQTSPCCRYREFGGTQCGLDLVANNLKAIDTNVIAVNEAAITIDNPVLSDNFINGTAVFSTGSNKNIVYSIRARDLNNTFTLNKIPYRPIQIGDKVTVTAFCDRTQDACQGYNNYINFGNIPVGGGFIPGLDKILVIN